MEYSSTPTCPLVKNGLNEKLYEWSFCSFSLFSPSSCEFSVASLLVTSLCLVGLLISIGDLASHEQHKLVRCEAVCYSKRLATKYLTGLSDAGAGVERLRRQIMIQSDRLNVDEKKQVFWPQHFHVDGKRQ